MVEGLGFRVWGGEPTGKSNAWLNGRAYAGPMKL